LASAAVDLGETRAIGAGLDDDRWVREPGAWYQLEDLPRLVRELFGLP
jgi:hypothetical protein